MPKDFRNFRTDTAYPHDGSLWFRGLPRKTSAERDSITGMLEGDMIFNTDLNYSEEYTGSAWQRTGGAGTVSEAFKTMDCPLGTDPVAGTATDTLAFASSDGKIAITGNAGTKTITLGVTATSLVDADINANAVIAWSKMAGVASANLIVGSAGGVATVTPVTGDISISNTGVVAITSNSVVNSDVNTGANIAWTKMATLTSAHILVGNGSGEAADVAMGGVIAIDNTGVTSIVAGSILNADVGAGAAIVESKIAFDAAGHDHDGVGSALVSAGIASVLANNVTCEAGAFNYTIAFGVAGAAYTLTVPVVSGARTFAFINEAQEWTANQIVQYGHLLLRDNDEGQTLQVLVNENMTGDRTLTLKVNDANRAIDISGDITTGGALTTGGTFIQTGAHNFGFTTTGNTAVTFPTTGTLAVVDSALGDCTVTTINKYTLTPPAAGATLTIADGKTLTCNNSLTLSGTDGKTLTISESMNLTSVGVAQTFTMPTVGDTIAGRASTDTFTNKSIDADGAGNSITNLDPENLDPIAWPAASKSFDIGQKFTIVVMLSNEAAAFNIYNTSAPFKFRVVNAYSINQSADGGTWQLNNGAAGAGTDIHGAVTVAASDKDIDSVTQIDDTGWVVASGGSLSVKPDGGGLLDCTIFIDCIRLD